ncbi:unnamed protein product [Ectocarpus sp. 6 AP-2014]
MENNTSVVMHVVMANNKDSGEFYRGKTPTNTYSVNLRDDISAVNRRPFWLSGYSYSLVPRKTCRRYACNCSSDLPKVGLVRIGVPRSNCSYYIPRYWQLCETAYDAHGQPRNCQRASPPCALQPITSPP